jgi:DNA-binding response OmpR family regulator
MAGKNIVIIEDDQGYLEVLTQVLSQEGYNVITGETGFDLVDSMVDDRPDLIITDLMLPDLSGDKIVGTFQKRDVLAGVPVIVISSRDEEDIREAAKTLNAVDYMRKPVDNQKLIELVKKHIG